jgi:hypothetical protein
VNGTHLYWNQGSFCIKNRNVIELIEFYIIWTHTEENKWHKYCVQKILWNCCRRIKLEWCIKTVFCHLIKIPLLLAPIRNNSTLPLWKQLFATRRNGPWLVEEQPLQPLPLLSGKAVLSNKRKAWGPEL